MKTKPPVDSPRKVSSVVKPAFKGAVASSSRLTSQSSLADAKLRQSNIKDFFQKSLFGSSSSETEKMATGVSASTEGSDVVMATQQTSSASANGDCVIDMEDVVESGGGGGGSASLRVVKDGKLDAGGGVGGEGASNEEQAATTPAIIDRKDTSDSESLTFPKTESSTIAAHNLPSKNTDDSDAITLDRSPRESISSDRSHRESITLDHSPRESITLDPSPRESITLDRSPRELITLDRSPRESITLDHSPRESITLDHSPCESPEVQIIDSENSDVEGDVPTFYGVPLESLNRSPHCYPPLPELRPRPGEHDILFRPHLRSCEPPRPFPNNYSDAWDHHHVRMPCSPKNMCPTEGGTRVTQRWNLIRDALDPAGRRRHHNDAAAADAADNRSDATEAPFILSSSFDLEEAVLSYNPHYTDKWNFRTLHSYFHEEIGPAESQRFFYQQLPQMVRLCLSLREVVTSPPPLLRKLTTEGSRRVTLSRHQVAALLANAFFCTFPRRNALSRNSEFASFPEINFNRLFAFGNASNKHEKLKALLHYFHRVTERKPLGTISYTRQKVTSAPAWKESQKTLPQLHVSSTGKIEEADGLTQVDFANKYLGGGTLGSGCVQEEIRFLICPELILSQLIAEELDHDECLIIVGAERYSNYSGYASSFKWGGNFIDRTRSDAWGRKCVEVVAMDALRFSTSAKQYSLKNILRELNKAHCAFHRIEPAAGRAVTAAAAYSLPAVATGNWGCGAFGGDPYLKSLIQLMAAAEADRDVAYFTFGDVQLAQDLFKMHDYLTGNGVTVAELWRFFLDMDRRAADRSYDKRNLAGRGLFKLLSDWVENGREEEVDEKKEEGEEGKEEEAREEGGEGKELAESLGEDGTEGVAKKNERGEDEKDGAFGEEMAAQSLKTPISEESPDLFTDDDDDDIPGESADDAAGEVASLPSLAEESQETERTVNVVPEPVPGTSKDGIDRRNEEPDMPSG